MSHFIYDEEIVNHTDLPVTFVKPIDLDAWHEDDYEQQDGPGLYVIVTQVSIEIEPNKFVWVTQKTNMRFDSIEQSKKWLHENYTISVYHP